MREKKPFSEVTTENSTEMIKDKEKIMLDEKNFPRGAFNPNKGSK